MTKALTGTCLAAVGFLLAFSAALCASEAAPAGRKECPCRVEFRGNTVFSSSRLRSLCVAGAQDSRKRQSEGGRAHSGSRDSSLAPLLSERWVENNVIGPVLQAYCEAGYLDAVVESTCIVEAACGPSLVVFVREGVPARVGSFGPAGNSHFSCEELVLAGEVRSGWLLSAGVLEGACERMVDFMAREGFPFADVYVSDFTRGEHGIDFLFIVREGPRCRVEELRLESSSSLSREAMFAAFRVKPGEVYRENKIVAGVRALRKSGLFADVGEPLVTRKGEDGVAVAVPVKERKGGSFGGAVGFRGRTGEVTGGVSVALPNIAHTGRGATAGWESMGRRLSSFALSYKEPWVMGLPFSSSFRLEHTVRDTLFARTVVSVVLRIPVSSFLSGQIGGSYEKTLVTDVAHARATRLAWIAGIEVSAGEPPWKAGNSLLLEATGSRGVKETSSAGATGGTERGRDVLSTGTGRVFLQRALPGGQFALLDVKGSAVLEGKDLVSPEELFALGGKRNLRGYSEQQFMALSVASAQIEYGLAVGEEGGRVFLFLDCGYASTPQLSTSARLHVGYGVGLKVPSPFGLAGIDFGVPAGESLGFGKVHVGLDASF
ncbi:MAG: BamA/TamA family outer membrane protein [Candidatus Eisenbacteria bacterium]